VGFYAAVSSEVSGWERRDSNPQSARDRPTLLFLARLCERTVAEPLNQNRILTVNAVLHRVLDDPAEAGIIQNAIVNDEAEGADLTLATWRSAW
jgi:hypothetical protein